MIKVSAGVITRETTVVKKVRPAMRKDRIKKKTKIIRSLKSHQNSFGTSKYFHLCAWMRALKASPSLQLLEKS